MRVNYQFTMTTWLINQNIIPSSLSHHLYTGSSVFIALQVGIMEHKNYRVLKSSVMRDMENFYK